MDSSFCARHVWMPGFPSWLPDWNRQPAEGEQAFPLATGGHDMTRLGRDVSLILDPHGHMERVRSGGQVDLPLDPLLLLSEPVPSSGGGGWGDSCRTRWA